MLAGYYADGGFEGELKSGLLMTVFMIIPVFLLGGILGTVLRGSPVLEGPVAASTLIIILVIIIHAAITGIVGSVAGAIIAGRKVL